MSARVTLKAVNQELARLGHDVLLAKGSGYFYFWTGEAADWLDRTVNVNDGTFTGHSSQSAASPSRSKNIRYLQQAA